MRLTRYVDRHRETLSLQLVCPARRTVQDGQKDHVVSLQCFVRIGKKSYDVCVINGTVVAIDDTSTETTRASEAFQLCTGLWPAEFEEDPRCQTVRWNGPELK